MGKEEMESSFDGATTYFQRAQEKMRASAAKILLPNENLEKSQEKMAQTLQNVYGEEFDIQKGEYGSFEMIFKDNIDIPVVTVDGVAENGKYGTLMNLTRHYKDGSTRAYVCVNRLGDFYSDKTGVTTSVIYKDEYGRKWIFVLKEARPIQLAQKGPDARNLAGVTGLIDENDESTLDTVVREVKEELGLKIKKENCIPMMNHVILTSQGMMTEAGDSFVVKIAKLERATDENGQITRVDSDRGVTRSIYVVPADRCVEWDKRMNLPGGAGYANIIATGCLDSVIDD